MTTEFINFPTPHAHPKSLDTASTVEAFADREVELGSGAITATDHGSLAAVREIYDLARGKDKKKAARNLIAIPGVEAYMRDDDCPLLRAAGLQKRIYDPHGADEERANAERFPTGSYRDDFKYGHITLHLLDQPAYELCSTLLSKADDRAEVHGSERKPLFGWAELEQLGAANVTVGSGCLIGMVQRHLLERDDIKTALAYYRRLRSIFKPGNFYVEVFPHDCSRNWVDAIFMDLEGGERLRFTAKSHSYGGKTVRVSGEVLKVDQLLKRKELGVLEATQDYRRWNERPPKQILKVERVEGFIENECRPWAGQPNVQAAANRVLLRFAEMHGDPVLISDDAHYARPDDKAVQDMRLAQSGNWRFFGNYGRQTSAEAFEHFQATLGITETQFRSWLDNNRAWAERFKGFEFKTPVSLPTKFYPSNTLAHLGALLAKHGRMRAYENDPRYMDRFRKELAMLHANGTVDLLPYFFLAEEAVGVYAEKGLLTGPGRGSAAGLLLAYWLGITHVDPLEHDLSLERFITLDRIQSGAMPDIDLDFAGRDLLTDPENGWLIKRFGDHQAQISTDMTLKARAACKDAVRMTRGEVPSDVEILTKRFEEPPQGVNDRDFIFGYTSEDGKETRGSIETDVALQEYVARYPKEWALVVKALGLARNKGRHACLPAGERIFSYDGQDLVVRRIEECDQKTVPTGQGTRARAVLVKSGVKQVLEYRLANGKTIRATKDHKVLTTKGWMSIQAAFQEQVDLVEPTL